MSGAAPNLRLDGIYQQRQKEFFMQRIKLPGGSISAPQARVVAMVAERFARGLLHLTTRGSIELHWLSQPDLVPVAKLLASVGLVSRGACGGAVRGVCCNSMGVAQAPKLEALVRRFHKHFTGNPHFENLPKKFKIGVEADTVSGRHLIQDIGVVPAPSAGEEARYDVWVAGGLGREPIAGFPLVEGVSEERLIPLVEAVLRVYRAHAPSGKRVKHVVREVGAEAFRQMVLADPAAAEELPVQSSLADTLVAVPENPTLRFEVALFAGELKCSQLATLADLAERHAGGGLLITSDQNVLLHLEPGAEREQVERDLHKVGLGGTEPRDRVRFRICPGSHECIMGLAPTRDIAEALLKEMEPAAQQLTWAISGCPNSCAQPQLAQGGIVVSRLASGEQGRSPRFDLYRMGEGPFAEVVEQGLDFERLLEAVQCFNVLKP